MINRGLLLIGAAAMMMSYGPTALAQDSSPCAASSQLENSHSPNASRLCVVLDVKDGRLVADQKRSRLHASDVIDNGHPVTDARRRELEKEFLDDLAAQMRTLPKLYEFGLTDSERRAGTLDATVTAPLDTYDAHSWDKLITTYEAWAGKKEGRRSLDNALQQAFAVMKLDLSTALFTVASGLETDMGRITLGIADTAPDVDDEQHFAICFGRPGSCVASDGVLDRARMKKVLHDVAGHPWRSTMVRQRLEQYYRNRGLQLASEVDVSRAASPVSVTIPAAIRITRIVWSKSLDTRAVLVEEFLSALLSRSDFSFYGDNKGLVADISIGGSPEFRALSYAGVGGASGRTLPSPPPLLNNVSLGSQQAALDGLDLIVTVHNGPNGEMLLVVQPKAPAASGEKPESAPAAPSAQPVDRGTARADSGPVSPAMTPRPVTPESMTKPPAPPPGLEKNFLGFGIEYRPGQRIKTFGQFQRSGTQMPFAIGSLAAQLGGNGEAFGSGTLRLDYLLFEQLHRRLSAEINGGSDFTQQRLLAGLPTDERRTGGYARGEYEVLGGANNTRLTLSAQARQDTVHLTAGGEQALATNLTAADVGGTFTAQSLTSLRPFQMRLEASVKLGWSDGAPFRSVTTIAHLNQHLFDRILTTFDVSGRLQLADAGTPLFEQPSLGGADVLRGFRADDAIGRRMWTVQPELWFEMPALFGSTAVGRFLHQQTRIAGFVDVGAVDHVNAPGIDGFRAGPGVGLRVFQGPLAVKLDWAYGIGKGLEGRGHGRFYLGVSSVRTF